ncbi:MAG: hypothetical protein H7336_09090 [Bacteriovorax sp.]|nr:hypothetical protein [Bacteriovorax sp.]
MSEATKDIHHAEVASTPELPKEPTVNADGIKIYPTSFIPGKAHMNDSRIPTEKLDGLTIEILHVIIFFVLTIGLFYSMWKKPNVR